LPRPVSEIKNNARTKGLRATLLYLKPETVKRLKHAAITEGRPAYEVTEDAIQAYLAERHKDSR
jgi:hypothetical protein